MFHIPPDRPGGVPVRLRPVRQRKRIVDYIGIARVQLPTREDTARALPRRLRLEWQETKPIGVTTQVLRHPGLRARTLQRTLSPPSWGRAACVRGLMPDRFVPGIAGADSWGASTTLSPSRPRSTTHGRTPASGVWRLLASTRPRALRRYVGRCDRHWTRSAAPPTKPDDVDQRFSDLITATAPDPPPRRTRTASSRLPPRFLGLPTPGRHPGRRPPRLADRFPGIAAVGIPRHASTSHRHRLGSTALHGDDHGRPGLTPHAATRCARRSPPRYRAWRPRSSASTVLRSR